MPTFAGSHRLPFLAHGTAHLQGWLALATLRNCHAIWLCMLECRTPHSACSSATLPDPGCSDRLLKANSRWSGSATTSSTRSRRSYS